MSYAEVVGVSNRLLYFGLPSFLMILLCLTLENYIKGLSGGLMQLGVYLGDASYAIYLSHLYVIEFMRKLMPKFIDGFAINSLAGNIVTILLAILVGGCLYSVIDKPFSKYCKIFLTKLFGLQPKPFGRVVTRNNKLLQVSKRLPR